jgi:hypothetical protein
VPSAQPPPRSVPFASHGFLRPPRPATREIRGQMGASGFRGQAAGRQAAARPSRARATTRHARTAQRTEASGGAGPPAPTTIRLSARECVMATSRGIRRHRLTAVCLRRARPTGGVGPFHPGDMYRHAGGASPLHQPGARGRQGRWSLPPGRYVPAVIRHAGGASPLYQPGARIRARDRPGTGCIRWLGCAAGSLGSYRED